MVSLTFILFSTKCFLFVYMYIDLLKLKAYKLHVFENSDADLFRYIILVGHRTRLPKITHCDCLNDETEPVLFLETVCSDRLIKFSIFSQKLV